MDKQNTQELFFDTLLLLNSGFDNLAFHLERFAHTVEFLAGELSIDQLAYQKWYRNLAQELQLSGGQRVRIGFSRSSKGFHASVRQERLATYPALSRLAFSATAREINESFNYKLTTSAITISPDVDDLIITNSKNEICETLRANIYLRQDGVLYTPPLSCGVLAGTVRAKVLQEQRVLIANSYYPVTERVIHRQELHRDSTLYLSNALMGIVAAKILA